MVAGKRCQRAMAGGASGPEAFTLLLRLLMTYFDGVDTEEGYTKLHIFGMYNGTPFSDCSREFRVIVPTVTGSVFVSGDGFGVGACFVFCLRGRIWCWRWFGWRRMRNFRLTCLRCTLVRRQRTRGHTPRWMLCGGLVVTKRIIRHLLSTAKYFSLHASSTGARSSAPPGLWLADHGHGQGRVPSQSLSWQTGSSHHSTVMLIDYSSDPCLDHTSNC